MRWGRAARPLFGHSSLSAQAPTINLEVAEYPNSQSCSGRRHPGRVCGIVSVLSEVTFSRTTHLLARTAGPVEVLGPTAPQLPATVAGGSDPCPCCDSIAPLVFAPRRRAAAQLVGEVEQEGHVSIPLRGIHGGGGQQDY